MSLKIKAGCGIRKSQFSLSTQLIKPNYLAIYGLFEIEVAIDFQKSGFCRRGFRLTGVKEEKTD